jgi:integration host factor subunit alpha
MTLTKADLVKKLLQQGFVSKEETARFVESFFEEIRVTLKKGEEVKLTGLGNFMVRKKKARPGRNPRTGEDTLISARRVVTFHPGPKLKKKIAKQTKTK